MSDRTEQLAELGCDPGITEYTNDDGYTFRVGDRVVVTDEDEDQGLYDGDEGVILGFSHFDAANPTDDNYAIRVQFGNAAERTDVIVEWDDGRDPDTVRDPGRYLSVL